MSDFAQRLTKHGDTIDDGMETFSETIEPNFSIVHRSHLDRHVKLNDLWACDRS